MTGIKNSSIALKNGLGLLLKIVAIAAILFMIYCIIVGMPAPIGPFWFKSKTLRIPFVAFLAALFFRAFLSPQGIPAGLKSLGDRINRFTADPRSPWLIFTGAAILFTWQQITEYYSININFLPFSFYDYMLYYFWHGKINYTGLLHTYYHTNYLLYVLAPVWKLFSSPLILVLIYGPLAALPVFPLWRIAQKRFQEAAAPLLCVLVFLNYRYLQNILGMNFSMEILYSLFIFGAVSFAMQRRWVAYYACVAAGLLVKEDAFFYFTAVGLLIFFMEKGEKAAPYRKHGILTIFLSIAYLLLNVKLLMPLTGNNVFKEDMNNFSGHAKGGSLLNLASVVLHNPKVVFEILFGSSLKIETYIKLIAFLAFLPLFSPVCLLIFFPIFLLFFHSTGRDLDFIQLRFHYAGAVIPFAILAFVFGYSNLCRWAENQKKPWIFWGFFTLLLVVNGGHFRTEHFSLENLRSIAMVESIPREANLVTHGHLLPYAGYRNPNYYLAEPFELPNHPAHHLYTNADFYLIDKSVILYPLKPAVIDAKIAQLEKNPVYELKYHDSNRWLFKRRTTG